jgi:FixJ family two-component response regulator
MTDSVYSPAVQARTVVVVDDDPSVRDALRRLFRSAGLTVAAFASAEEFLQQSDVEYGFLVADVHLGRMNGLELQAELVRRGSAIPVVLISGVADAEMEVEALRLGAIAFLRKPFDVRELLNAVIAALGRNQTGRPYP